MTREKLEEMSEDIYNCCRCGYCRDMVRARDNTKLECPNREYTGGFDSYCAIGRNWVARQVLEGRVDPTDFSDEFIDHLFSDLLCGNCTQHCGVIKPEAWDDFPDTTYNDNAIDINEVTRALRGLVITEGNPPPEIRDILENVFNQGNPQGEPKSQRDAFLEELDFEPKDAADEDVDVLLYVGSVASYDDRSQKAAVSVAKILNEADVDFGVLGNEEIDSGWLAYDLGEVGLFEELANQNLEFFKENGIDQVVVVSPHDYDAFSNHYSTYLADDWDDSGISVSHYTEFVSDLLENGDLELEGGFDKTVTYHDSCVLGRRNSIFDSPRNMIEATGADLVEMELNRKNSFCCGGGGGLLWYEPDHEPKVENRRAEQAKETGADVIAVACPICTQMLDDGTKAVDGDMEVIDVAEMVTKAL